MEGLLDAHPAMLPWDSLPPPSAQARASQWANVLLVRLSSASLRSAFFSHVALIHLVSLRSLRLRIFATHHLVFGVVAIFYADDDLQIWGKVTLCSHSSLGVTRQVVLGLQVFHQRDVSLSGTVL